MYADNTMYPKAKESDKHIISIIRVNNSRNNRKAPEGKNWEGEHRSALQRWKKNGRQPYTLQYHSGRSRKENTTSCDLSGFQQSV